MAPSTTLQERANRILAGKLHLLFHNTSAICTNFVIACIVTWLLWGPYPGAVLIAWLAATLAVCAARLLLQRWYWAMSDGPTCDPRWATRFTLGALASGILWGLICCGLPFWGGWHEFILLTLVGAGMSAGALATISPHLPAYLCYTGAFALPLVAVSLTYPDKFVQGVGVMILVYFAAVSAAARRSKALYHRTIELKVDNEMLQESLKTTRLERDIARTERWSTLAQLSHEVRTPLNAILAFSEAIRDEYFGPLGHARYKDYARNVHDSGALLSNHITALLQVSQGESGVLTLDESEVDVASVVRSLVTMMMPKAHAAGLSMTACLPDGLPHLMADETKLRQMLFNLVDNAIKFTPIGGLITADVQISPQGSLSISVSDTGVGMDGEDIAAALCPIENRTTTPKGSFNSAGLGLPISKRLAELHGATLSIASEPKKGTTCTIAFPPARKIAPAGWLAA